VPGALIAKPIVLDLTLLLPCTDERRRGEFAGPGDAASLDQKQLAVSQSEKWFGALQIGASAEHIVAASCPVQHDHGKTIAASKWLHKHLSYHHLDLPAFCDYAANKPSLVASAVSIILSLMPSNRQFLPILQLCRVAEEATGRLPSLRFSEFS
jgi:hypothetical protein